MKDNADMKIPKNNQYIEKNTKDLEGQINNPLFFDRYYS